MKKKLALLLAVSMMLAMTSCGEVEGENSSEQAPANEVTQSAEDSTEEEPAEDTESTEEESSEDTSSEETVSSEADAESSAADTTSSEADTADSTDPLEDYAFDSYTYAQLKADGLANKSADGIYYALISQGGGAGHSFYTVWSTESGEWAESGQFQVANGNNTWFALDDGRLIRFFYETPAMENYPQVAVMTFTGGEIAEYINAETFSGQTYDDGVAIDGHGKVTFSAVYEGGYAFWLTFTGADGGVIDKEFVLDPDTFAVVE